MQLKQKLPLVCVAMALVPTIIVSALIGIQSYDSGRNAIEDQAKAQLISIRDIKKQQIEDYFETIKNQVLTFSNDRMMIDAMRAFKPAFANYRSEAGLNSLTAQERALSSYYQNDFLNEYRQRNNGETVNVRTRLNPLDQDSLALQHAFISDNPHPLGSKEMLTELADGSDYSALHAKYHPAIRDYLYKFEYYDIFLVDSDSGDVIYSVFKELDYTTSLLDGPYAQSGIAQAFRAANQANSAEFVTLTDFAPYGPSYEDPAAFIASPIFDGDEKLGVLIFQMPIDRINRIMTHRQNWTGSGLGASGETYLVGDDLRMRSMSRFLIEDQNGYIDLLNDLEAMPNTLVERIAAKGTSIGLQPVDTQGTRAALAGESDFAIFADYRNIPVLSAYAPLDIMGLKWAIMSEIDEAEAFAASHALKQQIWLTGGIVTLLIIAIASALGIVVARSMARPISEFTETLTRMHKESDLTLRVCENGNDEIAASGHAINGLLAKFQDTIQHLIETSGKLKQASVSMATVTSQTLEATQQQQDQSHQVATAATEMTASSQEVAQNAELTSSETAKANQVGEESTSILNDSIAHINALAKNVSEMEGILGEVAQDSNNIGNVLQVISDIAEQTNLLALNAAIEAARAGEQGRGFAVVADEVRTLAQRTHASTEEIRSTIQQLQGSIDNAVNSIKNGVEQANASVNDADKMNDALAAITNNLSSISDMNHQIAAAASEQLAVAEDISSNITAVSDLAGSTATAAQKAAQDGQAIDRLAEELQHYVSQFKA